MASQPTTNSPPVQQPSPVSPSSSPSATSAPPVQQPSPPATPTPPVAPPANSQSPNPSTSQQSQAPAQQSTSRVVSLSSTALVSPSVSQVASAPTLTSQPLPPTVAPSSSSSSQPSLGGNGLSNPPHPEAEHHPVSRMRIIIPAASAVTGILVVLLVYHFYRRYRRRQQLKEAPLPAKRTPVILEHRRAQSMYRFETPQTKNNAEYDSLMTPITFPPPSSHHSGTASHISFPSEASNTLDGAYTFPSTTPPPSASLVSLERQSSTVSPPTPSDELLKDPLASTLATLTSNYPPNAPSLLAQQPLTPPYARRDSRPIARHSRPLSIASVASRHSTYSLAAMRSGQHPGSGSTLRGAPHRNNVNIVLPQPLAPNSRPNSTYNMHYGEPPSVHLRHIGSVGTMSPHPLAQDDGLPPWNEHGELRHSGNASRDHMREEWEEGNSGNYQRPSPSLTVLPHPGMPHSQSAPATINWRHSGTPPMGPPGYSINMDVNAPPVPPLPQLSPIPRADSRASGTSSQNTLAYLTPPTPLAQLQPMQQPSPPRSPLSKQVSIDEKIPALDAEAHPAAELEKQEQIPQSEESAPRLPLLPDSVFADPDGELESSTHETRRTSASFTDAQPPPVTSLPLANIMVRGRTDTMDTVRPAAAPAAS